MKNLEIVEDAIKHFEEKIAEKFVDETAVIHIIGAFSAGKSRLVRELLSEHEQAKNLLPISSQERQTALPLEITYAETANLFQFELNDYDKKILLNQFPTREQQMQFNPELHRLRLEIPEKNLLLGNVELVSSDEGIKRLLLKDMPGWNSGDSFISENPLAGGLVSSDNISLVYVVQANRVDSQDDYIRLEAIFKAVESFEAFFYGGFNLVIVVTHCETPEGNTAIETKLKNRLLELAEKVDFDLDESRINVLCIDFSEKYEKYYSLNEFKSSFWTAVLNPIADKKTENTSSYFADKLEQPDLQIKQPLTESLALLKQAKDFVHNFKKEQEFIQGMNNTRLLGMSEKERRAKVLNAWKKQVGELDIHKITNHSLQLPSEHPLEFWWTNYWLKNLSIIIESVSELSTMMQNAIEQLPLEVSDLQQYFADEVESEYISVKHKMQVSFISFCHAIEPLKAQSSNATIIATLLSLSVFDAKYCDYYNLFKIKN